VYVCLTKRLACALQRGRPARLWLTAKSTRQIARPISSRRAGPSGTREGSSTSTNGLLPSHITTTTSQATAGRASISWAATSSTGARCPTLCATRSWTYRARACGPATSRASCAYRTAAYRKYSEGKWRGREPLVSLLRPIALPMLSGVSLPGRQRVVVRPLNSSNFGRFVRSEPAPPSHHCAARPPARSDNNVAWETFEF
jgi:hypothetical protein